MDTLQDRLAQLADDAPEGGAPAAELWARGKRAHRLRAAGLAATLLVVGAVGTGIGVGVADGDRAGPAPAGPDGDRSSPTPAGPDGITLPIEYPVGEELPDLGDTPGPLAAIWVAPPAVGGAPEAVGLVADTGTFGTLPIDVSYNPDGEVYDAGVALSPDGRRVAYQSASGELIVRDLASGKSYSPLSEFETRAGYMWSDATHLFGHVAGGRDFDGWVWTPGGAPKLINLLTHGGEFNIYPYGVGHDVWVFNQGGGPRSCSAPMLTNRGWPAENGNRWAVKDFCDVLGIVRSMLLLGHGNAETLSDYWYDPDDGNGTVVALSLSGRRLNYNGREVPPVVVTPTAPERVALATDLIGDLVLGADGGGS